jgi:hypothetical protein
LRDRRARVTGNAVTVELCARHDRTSLRGVGIRLESYRGARGVLLRVGRRITFPRICLLNCADIGFLRLHSLAW